jgi:hypothetical protein
MKKYNRQVYDTDSFVLAANRIHKNRYDYPKLTYIKSIIKVNIRCPLHGDFLMTPHNHLHGKQGCPTCGRNKTNDCIEQRRLTAKNEFKNKASKIYNKKYNYTKTEYINNHTKVIIICPIHGEFHQVPMSHLNGNGCPKCKSSKGELQLESILKNEKVLYKTQIRFLDCRSKNPLPFDFEILNSLGKCIGLIEYNGEHHYMPIKRWGGQSKLIAIKRRDKIKKLYCLKNNIPLLVISYKELNQLESLVTLFLKFIS